MKKKKNIWLLILMLWTYPYVFSQSVTLTPVKKQDPSLEQKRKDSLDFLKFNQEHPELFNDKRLPLKLMDGNYFIKGYGALGVRVTNNHITDSIVHNFNLDRSQRKEGTLPYSNIPISDASLSVDIMSSRFLSESTDTDSSSIVLLNEADLLKGKLDNKIYNSKAISSFIGFKNPSTIDTIGLDTHLDNSIEIRISLNGKLLFDWTSLDKFKRIVYKSLQKKHLSPNKPYSIVSYSTGYHVADYQLKINDQLLIEIKENKKNWMLDRFNFTRVAAKPTVSTITSDSKENKLSTILNGPGEKKTFYFPLAQRN